MPLSPRSSQDPVCLIVKVVGERCNIDCTYCYERQHPTSSKPNLLVQPSELHAALQQLQHSTSISVELHGGEPLLAGDAHLARLGNVLSTTHNVKTIRMQTNAVGLTKERIFSLVRLMPTLEFGISYDGPLELNGFRLDVANNQTAHRVEQAIEILEENKIPYGVISVVSTSNIGSPEAIIKWALDKRHLHTLKFAPAFATFTKQSDTVKRSKSATIKKSTHNTMPNWAITPDQFTTFLEAVWNTWVHHRGYRQLSIEPFDSFIAKIIGYESMSCHFSDRKCEHILTLYPGGVLGLCDELSPRPVGNISLYLSNYTNIGEEDELEKQCASCEVSKICVSGCMATRLRFARQGMSEDYCKHRRQTISFIQEKITEELWR